MIAPRRYGGPVTIEPVPVPRGRGRVIHLNGASSAGKSTLARRLQPALDEPYLYVSSDLFVAAGMLPARREEAGEFAWWPSMRPRFFDGFHRCLPALASAGNDLIVEEVVEFVAWRARLAQVLDGFDVFLVGVHCDLDELERRERVRGDRRIGEGRAHLEQNAIHTFGPYDVEVDTSAGVTDALVDTVLGAWRNRVPPSALFAGGA